MHRRIVTTMFAVGAFAALSGCAAGPSESAAGGTTEPAAPAATNTPAASPDETSVSFGTTITGTPRIELPVDGTPVEGAWLSSGDCEVTTGGPMPGARFDAPGEAVVDGGGSIHLSIMNESLITATVEVDGTPYIYTSQTSSVTQVDDATLEITFAALGTGSTPTVASFAVTATCVTG